MNRAGKDDALRIVSERKLNIVAVTACYTGVAHTYMAAEQLEKLAKDYQFTIKIETQGVLGIQNTITEKDISTTDLAIIAADIEIDNSSRFSGCRIISLPVSTLLLEPAQIISAIRKIIHYPKGKTIEL